MLLVSMTTAMVVATMVGMPNVVPTSRSHLQREGLSKAIDLAHLNWDLRVLHFGGKLLHGDTAHHGDGVEGGVDGVRGLAQHEVGLHGSTMKTWGTSLSRPGAAGRF